MTEDGCAELVECTQAALASLSSDFRKRRRFAITLCAIGQSDSQEHVLCNRSCAGGDDEGVGDGNIHRPEFHLAYGA